MTKQLIVAAWFFFYFAGGGGLGGGGSQPIGPFRTQAHCEKVRQNFHAESYSPYTSVCYETDGSK